MKIAFFGSPPFAVPSLLALHARFDVVLAVSQPDKAAGRGLARSRPAVAVEAERLGVPLAQPHRLRGNAEFSQLLAASRAELAVTTAYGKILPPALLDVPPHGFLNVHASLLPRYRGAAPVQWALVNGEQETGISIMRTEAGLDTGPVCLVRAIAIRPDEHAAELFERLARAGAEAVVEAVELLARSELHCRKQDESAATHAPMLRKEDGNIDWARPAQAVYDRHRGVSVWPGTRFRFDGRWVKVTVMGLCPEGTATGTEDGRNRAGAAATSRPGEVLRVGEDGVAVATGAGAVALIEVQPEGKARMRARDWANGYGVKPGVTLA